MRFVAIAGMLLFAAIACGDDVPPKTSGTVAAEDLPKASGTLDGKRVRFPKRTIPEGIKATLGLLGSCHHAEKDHSADDWKNSQKGNHIFLVLAKAQTVTVLDKKVEVSELVVTLPLSSGSIWVRSGDKVSRFAKYEFEKERPLTTWIRQAELAK